MFRNVFLSKKNECFLDLSILARKPWQGDLNHAAFGRQHRNLSGIHADPILANVVHELICVYTYIDVSKMN